MKFCTQLTPLALGLALMAALPANAGNTGVAFVHGTGKQTNAGNDYWTWEFINSVKSGLPNQAMTLVVNCDFDQYMWTAGAAG